MPAAEDEHWLIWTNNGMTMIVYGSGSGSGATANLAVVTAGESALASEMGRPAPNVSVAGTPAERVDLAGSGHRVLACEADLKSSIGLVCGRLVVQGRRILDSGCPGCRQWGHVTAPIGYDKNRDYSSNWGDRGSPDRYERAFNFASY